LAQRGAGVPASVATGQVTAYAGTRPTVRA